MTTPVIPLNSGATIPQIGFGVFRVDPPETQRIVEEALQVGYRHIDTAVSYRNEEAVGRAIAASGLGRDEVFVTTKLHIEEHGYESARDALPASLERLGLDYVDLYLIHWPAPQRNAYVDSWRALEHLQRDGLARSIGVSNFLPEHLDRVLEAGDVVPAVHQLELHPAFQQPEQRAHHESKGIVTEAWGPLGQGKYRLDEIPALTSAAATHGKSVHQVVIRWHLQQGRVVIPKTVTRDRMIENLQVFDFVLSDAEMEAIVGADRRERQGRHPLDNN